jgi:hypothetical protein
MERSGVKDLRQLDRFRFLEGERYSGVVNPDPQRLGVFRIPLATGTLRVLASSAAGWDHVSVSLKDRCPTWDEMSAMHRMFFRHDECAMQLHVPEPDHVNLHEHCLHIWRPWKKEIPRPPSILVGSKA